MIIRPTGRSRSGLVGVGAARVGAGAAHVGAACALAVVLLGAAPASAAPASAAPASAASASAASTSGAPAPAAARSQAQGSLTARVVGVQHGLGKVRLAGTADPGASVFVGGDVVVPAAVVADDAGEWSATIRAHSGERVLQIVQSGAWTALEVPVTLRILTSPTLTARVDDAERSIALAGSGYPGARIVLFLEDERVGTAKADDRGDWFYELRDLGFGAHRVGAVQHFDGSRNGGVEDVFTVDGSATDVAAEVDTDRMSIAVSGRGPVGTEIALERDGQPVLDGGAPVRVPVGDDGVWRATAPVPDGVRLVDLDAVTWSDGAEVGRTTVSVTVPQPLTAAVVETQGGRVVLGGTGEPAATVRFTHENGAPLLDADGAPVTATVGRGEWRRTIDATGLRGARVLVTQDQGGRVVGRASVTIP